MTIRIIGMLGIVVAICTIAAGIAGSGSNSDLRFRALVAIGIYLFAVSFATMALKKAGAVLLAVPLACGGLAAVFMSAMQADLTATILNVVVSLPLLCGPAFVVWRYRRVLR